MVKEQLVLILEACSVQVVKMVFLVLETKELRPSHQPHSLVVYLVIWLRARQEQVWEQADSLMLSTQAHLLLNNNQACLAQQVHRTLRHQLPFLERLLAYFKAQFLQMHLKVNSLLNCLAKRTLEPLTWPKQKVLL